MERRNQKKKQKGRRQRRAERICCTLAAASIVAGIGLCSAEEPVSSGEAAQTTPDLRTQEQMEREADRAAASRSKESEQSPRGGAEASDWNLLLVNPQNKLPEGFSPKLTRLKNGHAVDHRAYPALQRMMDDARSQGLSPLICSSYRTREQQESLYKEQVETYMARGCSRKAAEREAGKWVAVPGTSEHQTGLALDIVAEDYQLLDENQAETPEQKWLMKNAHKYGFILRYPKEKTEITGIGYEPWHYRYVGKQAAERIYRQGICLEEYLD